MMSIVKLIKSLNVKSIYFQFLYFIIEGIGVLGLIRIKRVLEKKINESEM